MLNFRTSYQLEFSKLKQERELISSSVDAILNRVDSNDLQVGSRVKCTYEKGSSVEGRIIWINGNDITVKRDGHEPLWLFKREKVQNISVGTLGKFERRLWQIDIRFQEIRFDLEDANVPSILLKEPHNYVEIVEITQQQDTPFRHEQYDFITFVHSIDDKSYRMKIQRGTVKELGFYQIDTDKKDIVDIIRSSERVYKSRAKNID